LTRLFCIAVVLTARQYFADQEIKDLATKIYERVDWPWMLNGGKTFSMGWHPETGFLAARWEHFCELMMIYLLAISAPTHPVSPDAWNAWTRPKIKYQGIEYISGNDPIFTHQYSHAWFDFRNKRDAYTDYFENSVKATKAHKLFCLSLRDRFPDYSEDLWGISASDYVKGYTAWGRPAAAGAHRWKHRPMRYRRFAAISVRRLRGESCEISVAGTLARPGRNTAL